LISWYFDIEFCMDYFLFTWFALMILLLCKASKGGMLPRWWETLYVWWIFIMRNTIYMLDFHNVYLVWCIINAVLYFRLWATLMKFDFSKFLVSWIFIMTNTIYMLDFHYVYLVWCIINAVLYFRLWATLMEFDFSKFLVWATLMEFDFSKFLVSFYKFFVIF